MNSRSAGGADQAGLASGSATYASYASITSAGDTVAAPSLPTSTPAAKFAMIAASVAEPPAASVSARYAVTVSPAPTTSYTSRAAVGFFNDTATTEIYTMPRS